MIKINDLKQCFDNDAVLITEHASIRFRQRNLKIKDICNAVMSGKIIEQYPDDYPFPSCLVLGKTASGDYIHVVISYKEKSSRIITAYYPDKTVWNDDFTSRR